LVPLLTPDTQLGRYTILGKLATGGMSEIYLARQSGPSGFSKVLVLKVILPHLADDPSFMQMFHNEAKLAALLNHPNVVQIFDFGVVDQQHFMAMEYIDGQNLRRIRKSLRQRGQRIPRPIGLRIISDICGALEYAHSLRDPAGNHLQIIHRDVSLENILVTYPGQVKLVDFGIAKAAILESYTSQGTLKGKYSYMAPELVRGEAPDHRIDIFAVGVALYGALLGRMPFKGQNHAQILDAILNQAPPPPRELDPDLPPELEQVLHRALHKDRDQRYQRAGEIQAELEAYLMRTGQAVMPFHLAEFMSATFPAGTDQSREVYQHLAGATSYTPSRPSPGPPITAQPAGAGPAGNSDRRVTVPLRPVDNLDGQETLPLRPLDNLDGKQTLPLPLVDQEGQPLGPEDLDGQETLPLRPEDLDGQETIPVPGTATIVDLPDPATHEYLVPEAQQSAPAELALLRPTWKLRLLMVLMGASMAGGVALGIYLIVLGLGEEEGAKTNVPDLPRLAAAPVRDTAPRPHAPDARPAPAPAPRAAAPAAAPDLAAAPAAPDLGAAPASAPGLTAAPAAAADLAARPPAAAPPVPGPAPETGTLTIQTLTPAEANLDGQRLGPLPIERRIVPAGRHRLVVRSRQHGFQMTQVVRIKPGAHLPVRLEPRKGKLRILVRPWAKVILDGRPLGITPLATQEVYEGPHRLVLENADLGARKRMTVQVKPGEESVVKARMD
jgi:serine/threonine protein kinase